jgi:hypothetical protein
MQMLDRLALLHPIPCALQRYGHQLDWSPIDPAKVVRLCLARRGSLRPRDLQ